MATAHYPLRQVQVNRYIAPFREGGSLPALVAANDGFDYVIKFRGAGQGTKALVADLLGGELARMAGFQVPELVIAHVDPAFGRSEPDEEIQDLLKASEGLNLGVHFLRGALTLEPAATTIAPLLASKIVWLDYLLTNVDRTARNSNLLWWKNEVWLIDHGASFIFHHQGYEGWEAAASKPFDAIKLHLLLPFATELQAAHELLFNGLKNAPLHTLLQQIPDDWLAQSQELQSPAEIRRHYQQFIENRLEQMPHFLTHLAHARATSF